MRRQALVAWFSLCLMLTGRAALAHMTPPVVLLSEQEAVVSMTGGATKFFVREVRLTPAEREAIQQQWGWRPEEEFYRFYLGRNEAGELIAAVIFLTEFTIHGPLRTAVGLSADGTVRDARIVELTEETFPWLKPLLDLNFTRDYAGRNSQAAFGLSERFTQAHLQSMPQFYGNIVASLIQRAAILFEITVLRRAGKN